MSTDLEKSKIRTPDGIKLASNVPWYNPLPQFYNVVPRVKSADQFTFIFRLTSYMGAAVRAPESAPQMSNVVFVLPLNPYKESRSQAKNITFTLTDGGYVATNWGNGLINLSFQGSTGRLIPFDEYSDSELFAKGLGVPQAGKPTTIRDTRAWKVFMKFNYLYQYYNGGNEAGRVDPGAQEMLTPRTAQVTLAFWDKVYVGALTEFSYDVDANDPWQVRYSFKFVSFPIQEKVGDRTSIASTGIMRE